MKFLITGITGFAGSHLADFLLRSEPKAEVAGIYRWRSRTENVEHLAGKVSLLECDIRDATATREVIESFRPDYVFHLAAQSFVPSSWKAPQETLSTNIIGQLNIFESVREFGINPMIQIAGSSEEYGEVRQDELPIKETCPLRPLSPYGVSKVGQDLLGFQYFKSFGLKVIRTRAFNHTGPRRGDVFACSDFARQIAMIEKGKKENVIKTGNLDAIRDFTDVRDIVRAYWLSLQKGEPGEAYNICSGKGYTIGEVLDILCGLTKTKIKIKKDLSRMRPSDVQVLVGDGAKFRKKTGWKPEIPFKKTMKDLLEYWREYA